MVRGWNLIRSDLTAVPGIYEAHYTPLIKPKEDEYLVFTRKRKILTADSLSAAIRGCDTFVKNTVLPDKRILQYA
jgi:hypothetical protein